jgi:hypothetical protein
VPHPPRTAYVPDGADCEPQFAILCLVGIAHFAHTEARAMSDEILRKIHLDTRLDSYRNFFSDDWGQRINSLAETAPKLSALVFGLMMEWRATAYTASLPVAIIDHLKAYHDGFVNTGEINTTLLRLAETVTPILCQRIPELTADPFLISRLRTEIVKIGAQLEDARSATKVDFSLEETWQEYLKSHVYQLSLWGSQQTAYVSIYNAYESFLADLVGIARSADDLRTSDTGFKTHLNEAFGATLKERCWTCNGLHIAREARHALTHAGGRVTKKLANLRPAHTFMVIDRRIQVTPEKTKELFALLKDCVYVLAERAVSMSEFK